jgi:hypothetical protein
MELSSLLPLLSILPFCAVDWALTRCRIQQPYYLLHVVHNAAVVYLTAPDVVASFTDFTHISSYPTNIPAAALVVSFHLYHIVRYWGKLILDDWLHHGLMIGVAIPIGLGLGSGPLMGFSLFFATGLPGGLSYAILFAAWNGWLPRLTVKKLNAMIHTWIRAPGCLAHATLTAAYALSSEGSPTLKGVALIPAALMAWNGLYFMGQVVRDAVRREEQARAHEHAV